MKDYTQWGPKMEHEAVIWTLEHGIRPHGFLLKVTLRGIFENPKSQYGTVSCYVDYHSGKSQQSIPGDGYMGYIELSSELVAYVSDRLSGLAGIHILRWSLPTYGVADESQRQTLGEEFRTLFGFTAHVEASVYECRGLVTQGGRQK